MMYRVAHDVEYQPVWRYNVPEVFHFDQLAPTKITKLWQYLIMDINPGLTGRGFRSLFKYDRAFTNYTGYDYPNHSERRDYINKRDLLAKPLIFDKVRVCGGALISGKPSGDILTVETLNGSKNPPKAEWLIDHPWLYFRAVVVLSDGSIINFPQNFNRPVYIPLVATGKVTVKINSKQLKKPYPYVIRI